MQPCIRRTSRIESRGLQSANAAGMCRGQRPRNLHYIVVEQRRKQAEAGTSLREAGTTRQAS